MSLGFSQLKHELSHDNISKQAKFILHSLLRQHDISLDACNTQSPPKRPRPQESLFASILNELETSETPVSAKQIIKNCCLAIDPGKVPAQLDAKEMVLAALHFLSSLEQPLIRPTQETADLEKRFYELDSEISPFPVDESNTVQQLEHIFYESAANYRWLPREVFLPSNSMTRQDRELLLQKGNPPPSALGKAKKVASGASRSNNTSNKRKEKDDRVQVTRTAELAMDASLF